MTSNLFSAFDARFGSTSAWQKEILRAAQVWAQHTNINFTLITDSGGDLGSGLFQQGDPTMADIRLGGYDFVSMTLAQAYMPPPVNNYSIAGDIQFNTGQSFNIGTTYDLFTVAVHEIGHALGMYHSTNSTANMYGTYQATRTVLTSDDISGIRNIYSANAVRAQDPYDANGANSTFATADNLSSLLDLISLQTLVENLDSSTNTDVDYYKFIAPVGLAGVLNLRVQSAGLSLFSPKVTVYASNQTTILGSATGQFDYDGVTLDLTIPGITVGSTYYLKVQGAETGTNGWQSFNTGRYALGLGFAGIAAPLVIPPITSELNGLPLTSGGGQATTVVDTYQVAPAADSTSVSLEDSKQVAVDSNGTAIVVWASTDPENSYNLYARRYNSQGKEVGNLIRINSSTTSSIREHPAVAVDSKGNFVVVWVESGTTGNDIYARGFNSGGSPVASQFRVNTVTTGTQNAPAIAIAPDGRFVVVWKSDNQLPGISGDIFGQRYNANGTKAGSEFRVNDTTVNNQDAPDVAMDGSANFVVTWSSKWILDEIGYDIYAKGYYSGGVAYGSETRINTETSGDQIKSKIALDKDGNVLIVWESHATTIPTIKGQRYVVPGVTAGVEFRISDGHHGATQPGLAMDLNGNTIVTWKYDSISTSNGVGVYAKQYSAGGTDIGNEFQVNDETTGTQANPAIATNERGDIVFVWDNWATGQTTQRYAKRYLANASSGLHNIEPGQPHGFGPFEEDDDHHYHSDQEDRVGHLGTSISDYATDGLMTTDAVDPVSRIVQIIIGIQSSSTGRATITQFPILSMPSIGTASLHTIRGMVVDTRPIQGLDHDSAFLTLDPGFWNEWARTLVTGKLKHRGGSAWTRAEDLAGATSGS